MPVLNSGLGADGQFEVPIIFMGQNISDLTDPRHPSNWHSHPQHPDVLSHRHSPLQLQLTQLRVAAKELQRETALLNARLNNPHLYVCRLHYYQLSQGEADRDPREVTLYTDCMLRLRAGDWSREKMLHVLQGLKRLVIIYGPFRINEQMVGQSEQGDVRVWISGNLAHNTPASPCASEEQTTASFAALLALKNEDLANCLLGCRTLRDAADKLSRPSRETSSPFHSYSHRASDSGDLHCKKFEANDKFKLGQYRNVFKEGEKGSGGEEGCKSPKLPLKPYDYPQSAVPNWTKEEAKPQSNTSNFHKYRDLMQPLPLAVTPPHKVNHKSTNKMTDHDSSLQFAKNVTVEEKKEKKFAFGNLSANLEEGKHETQAGRSPTALPSGKTCVEAFRSFPPKFESMANYSSPNFISGKNRAADWSPYEPNLFATQCSASGGSDEPRPSQSHNESSHHPKQQRKCFDVTIINNNVNNYINNITHNHMTKPEPPSPQTHFRPPKTQEFQPFQSTPLRSNQTSQMGGQANTSMPTNMMGFSGKGYNVPVFLQQKKKQANSHYPQEHLFFANKSKSNNMLSRKDTVSSNPQEKVFNDFPEENPNKSTQESFISAQAYQPRPPCPERKPEKLFTFSRPNQAVNRTNEQAPVHKTQQALSPFKATNSSNNKSALDNSSCKMASHIAPRTPKNFSAYNPSSPLFFQKSLKSGFSEFKAPSRTKTTEFYNNSKEINKQQTTIQNKSFTMNEAEKPKAEKPQVKRSKYVDLNSQILEEVSQQLPTTQSIELVGGKSKENSIKIEELVFKKTEPRVDERAITTESPKPEPEHKEEKVDMKKQLRLEFGSLLGQPKSNKPQQQRPMAVAEKNNNHTDDSQTQGEEKANREGGLKDKIKMKQMAFAELKKQALLVLTDD